MQEIRSPVIGRRPFAALNGLRPWTRGCSISTWAG
jgi:hypothetical protein